MTSLYQPNSSRSWSLSLSFAQYPKSLTLVSRLLLYFKVNFVIKFHFPFIEISTPSLLHQSAATKIWSTFRFKSDFITARITLTCLHYSEIPPKSTFYQLWSQTSNPTYQLSIQVNGNLDPTAFILLYVRLQSFATPSLAYQFKFWTHCWFVSSLNRLLSFPKHQSKSLSLSP